MRRKTVVAVTAFLVSLGFKYLLLAINGETIGRFTRRRVVCDAEDHRHP